MDEFEVMRQQLASLKSQLDTQHIVNNELMRKVMRNKASWLNMLVKVELISLPFLYLLIVGICYVCNISQWFSFIFIVCAGIDAILDLRTISIPNHLFSSSSILDLKRLLIRQKKERFIQTCIGGTFSVIWVILFVYNIWLSNNAVMGEEDGLWSAVMTGGLFGGIIGAIVALIVLTIIIRKIQRTNDQILADIEDLETGGK